MSPTIQDGAHVFYDTSAYASAAPARGDIVVFRHDGKIRILRAIALPGETVSIEGGSVAVRGKPLDERYLAAGTVTQSPTKTWTVLADAYFLLADNRARDGDSCQPGLGFVPRSEIIGQIH